MIILFYISRKKITTYVRTTQKEKKKIPSYKIISQFSISIVHYFY